MLLPHDRISVRVEQGLLIDTIKQDFCLGGAEQFFVGLQKFNLHVIKVFEIQVLAAAALIDVGLRNVLVAMRVLLVKVYISEVGQFGFLNVFIDLDLFVIYQYCLLLAHEALLHELTKPLMGKAALEILVAAGG